MARFKCNYTSGREDQRSQDSTRLFEEGGESLPVLYVMGLKDDVINGPVTMEFVKFKFKNV